MDKGDRGFHLSRIRHANTPKRDAFAPVNAGPDWPVGDGTILSLRLANLFDKTYAAGLRTDMEGNDQAIPGEPCRFGLQLTTRL